MAILKYFIAAGDLILKLNKINDNPFECIEQKIKKICLAWISLETFHYLQRSMFFTLKRKNKKIILYILFLENVR